MNDTAREKAYTPTEKEAASQLLSLTPRQHEVLEAVAKGKTNAQIARELGVSVKTIKNHRYRMCQQMGLSGSNALFRFALVALGKVQIGN